MNIVADRTTGTMEVTQSVQRWVLNFNHLKLYALSGDPRFLGVHQGTGQRPLHPKRRIPRPQTWRYVVSVCSALAAGWCTSCLTLFLGCDSICVVTSFFREVIFSLTSGNVGGLSSKGGGCSNTPSVLTGLEKLLTKFSSLSHFLRSTR